MGSRGLNTGIEQSLLNLLCYYYGIFTHLATIKNAKQRQSSSVRQTPTTREAEHSGPSTPVPLHHSEPVNRELADFQCNILASVFIANCKIPIHIFQLKTDQL